MNQFLVPQFIEVEPKIIGPITVRQFIIEVIGFLLIFIEYKTMDFWGFIITAIITFGIFGVIAFLKVNGRPFHYFFLNFVETGRRPRLRLWRKEFTDQEIKELMAVTATENKKENLPEKKLITGSHLEELALIVNTGGIYQSTELDLDYEKSQKR